MDEDDRSAYLADKYWPPPPTAPSQQARYARHAQQMRQLHANFELAVDRLQAAGKMGPRQAADARRWGNKVSRGAQPLMDLRRGLGYARGMR